LPFDNPLVGERLGVLDLPANTALVTVLRGSDVLLPAPDHVLEAGDEMVFVADSTSEQSVRDAIHGAELLRAPSTTSSDTPL
jgi:trk system potassium uptake protein TrkA